MKLTTHIPKASHELHTTKKSHIAVQMIFAQKGKKCKKRKKRKKRKKSKDSMDGNATAKTDVVQTAEFLTGKQRALRGLRYFCAVFAVVFVIGTLRLSSKDNPYLLPCLAVLGVFCFPPALVTGLGVMAIRQRRRWHWAVMTLVAAGCVVATAVAGILMCFQP